MTFLPVVERELRAACRQRWTYHARFYAALAALAVFAWMWMAIGSGAPVADRALYLFTGVSIVAFAHSLLAGLAVTADSISREKREGTLGLLFLTDLKGHDIVLGKLAASSLNSFYGLVAIFPVLALPMMLGGLTFGELFRMVLLLMSTLLLSLCAGMFASSVSRSDRRAQSLAFFLILFIAAFPPAVAWSYASATNTAVNEYAMMVSPAYGFKVLFDQPYRIFPSEYWSTLGISHALSWVFLLLASFVAPRLWQDKPSGRRATTFKAWWQQARLGNPRQRVDYRTRLLNITPYFWLASRDRSKPAFVLGFLGLCGLGVFWFYVHYRSEFDVGVCGTVLLTLHLILKYWIASESGRLFAEDRRSGALELTLSTPMPVEEILRGQISALGRQFGGAVAIVAFADLALIVYSDWGNTHESADWIFFWIASIFLLGMDMLTLAWLGMWLGLTTRKPGRLAVAGVARVIAMPTLIMIFLLIATRDGGRPMFVLWMLLKMGLDGYFIVSSRDRLRDRFRTEATGRFDGPKAKESAAGGG